MIFRKISMVCACRMGANRVSQVKLNVLPGSNVIFKIKLDKQILFSNFIKFC